MTPQAQAVADALADYLEPHVGADRKQAAALDFLFRMGTYVQNGTLGGYTGAATGPLIALSQEAATAVRGGG